MEGGEHGKLAARVAAQVIEAYVNKQRKHGQQSAGGEAATGSGRSGRDMVGDAGGRHDPVAWRALSSWRRAEQAAGIGDRRRSGYWVAYAAALSKPGSDRKESGCGDFSHFVTLTGCCSAWCSCYRLSASSRYIPPRLHTKFVGFHKTQLIWLCGRTGLHVWVEPGELSPPDRLRALRVCGLDCRADRCDRSGNQGAGRAALDQAARTAFISSHRSG